MTRDLQRLEKLSSTAALGLWADDVVITLESASSGGALNASGQELLKAAANTLEEIRDEVDQPMVVPKSARSLATTDTTLSAVTALAREQDSDVKQMLGDMARAIRQVAHGQLAKEDSESLEIALDVFSLIGEYQLAESNAVLMPRKDRDAWSATKMTSASS
jgi:hypothetical protein